MDYLPQARQVLDIESKGIQSIADQLDERFNQFVSICLKALKNKNKLVLSGIGKSGQIAQKMASTLSSTGSRAVFIHPVEAMHGDLGMMYDDDVFIGLSYSGETDELLKVIPAVKRLGLEVLSLTGNVDSSLGQSSSISLPCKIDSEACPFNLAPTTTTTAMLALGDALAMVLMEVHDFKINDYGKLHPSGAIGRAITLTVEDLMRTGDRVAVIEEDTLVQEAVLAMCKSKGGMSIVSNESNDLLGIFTTGDLKRGIAKDVDFLKRKVSEVMVKSPTKLYKSQMAVDILDILREKNINAIPVVDQDDKVSGVIDIQDLPKFKVM
ncbi:KpsF/GutQ family sugar-phosphate isomerase [Lentisphaera marina]|uniref:KpsF/GutQ family sugar-phosphate isomerase n=1 Tax=Lentisphaera marina TaxID=1111041 RepID=UPI002365EEC4|nr:KpsF/GutQ family sugar-phosphate isomerase [Lentisphaera marina]MDD7984589.1 KpsF/GutQ family sugar-phosphate isomerase [Lentisphaera marina]